MPQRFPQSSVLQRNLAVCQASVAEKETSVTEVASEDPPAHLILKLSQNLGAVDGYPICFLVE